MKYEHFMSMTRVEERAAAGLWDVLNTHSEMIGKVGLTTRISKSSQPKFHFIKFELTIMIKFGCTSFRYI